MARSASHNSSSLTTGPRCLYVCIYIYIYIIYIYIYIIIYVFMYICKNDYSLSSFHHEFRRERKPDFAEEKSVGLLKALRRGRRD